MIHLYRNIYIDHSLVFELLASMFRVQSHENLLPIDPENYEFVPKELTAWVTETRKQMDDNLKRDLNVFFHYESYLGLLLVPICWRCKTYKDINSFLAFLEEIPSEEIIRGFLCTGFGDNPNIYTKLKTLTEPREVMEYIKSKNLPQEEKWKLFFMYFDADHTKQQFIRLIKTFFESFFKDKIDFLLKHHEDSINCFAKLLEDDTENKLNKFLNVDISDYDDMKEIILFPSYFYNTCCLSSIDDEISTFIYLYGTRQPEIRFKKSIDGEKLIEAIKALADENRMKMIRILNTAPSYGYELGQKLGLSNSTVAHHLSILSNHGFIYSYRYENKVYYKVNRDYIKKVLSNADQFLT